jgi:hypothetical protein
MRHRRVRSKLRPGLKAPTSVALAAAIALLLPAVAESRLPQPIYFFTNTAQPINKQNPLVIRPKGFLLFQDGQWVLERLRWTGWGSSVAQATGVSNSSNDIPDAAGGKRIKTWARVALSDPGRFQGHEVYRCFTLTVPPPATDMHLCLGHPPGASHGIYILEPAKQPAPAPTAVGFLAGHGLNCEMHDEPGPGDSNAVFCESARIVSEGGEIFAQTAMLQPNGQVASCSGSASHCDLGNAGTVPTYSPGKVVTVGAFTCKVLEAGVECTVTATGKGFLITPESVTEVGG